MTSNKSKFAWNSNKRQPQCGQRISYRGRNLNCKLERCSPVTTPHHTTPHQSPHKQIHKRRIESPLVCSYHQMMVFVKLWKKTKANLWRGGHQLSISWTATGATYQDENCPPTKWSLLPCPAFLHNFFWTDVDRSPGCQLSQAKLLRTKSVWLQNCSWFLFSSRFSFFYDWCLGHRPP